VKVIDLFAGCGGLSLGFLQAGFTIGGAVEFDPPIANTYKLNNPQVKMFVDDIRNVDTNRVFSKNDADIIIGGPPCQGFSMAGARIRHSFIDDPRNYLFKHYFNVVREVRPKAFVMENVKGMKSMQGGKIFEEILRIFSDPEMNDGVPFCVHHRIVNAVEFGIPQKRERLVIIGATCSGMEEISIAVQGYTCLSSHCNHCDQCDCNGSLNARREQAVNRFLLMPLSSLIHTNISLCSMEAVVLIAVLFLFTV